VKGFVAQGGDVTRGDGSGGEVRPNIDVMHLFECTLIAAKCQSIYGGKFADEKQGLKTKPSKGSLAMANSGKNSNSSQFFIVLTDDETKLAKMSGKYVVFGKVKDSEDCQDVLRKLDEAGGEEDGRPREKVWIGGCGRC
jgi:cyclophilin family peptidyl-prolyl cis-trans isomerase